MWGIKKQTHKLYITNILIARELDLMNTLIELKPSHVCKIARDEISEKPL
jgi:hypothetical protein